MILKIGSYNNTIILKITKREMVSFFFSCFLQKSELALVNIMGQVWENSDFAQFRGKNFLMENWPKLQ